MCICVCVMLSSSLHQSSFEYYPSFPHNIYLHLIITNVSLLHCLIASVFVVFIICSFLSSSLSLHTSHRLLFCHSFHSYTNRLSSVMAVYLAQCLFIPSSLLPSSCRFHLPPLSSSSSSLSSSISLPFYLRGVTLLHLYHLHLLIMYLFPVLHLQISPASCFFSHHHCHCFSLFLIILSPHVSLFHPHSFVIICCSQDFSLSTLISLFLVHFFCSFFTHCLHCFSCLISLLLLIIMTVPFFFFRL